MSNDKHDKIWNFLKAKGYYIALTLCAVAIGVAGYVYVKNGDSATPPVEDTTDASVSLSVTEGERGAVSVIGTTPQQEQGTLTTQPKSMNTMWPVEGEVAAVFAADKLTYNETTRDWRVHHGIDLSAVEGTEVVAAADGTVYAVYDHETMGTTVVIRHADGYVTTYSSLSDSPEVAAGDVVSAGDVIGTVGTSALTEKALKPHVHFAVTKSDAPIDPQEFVDLD